MDTVIPTTPATTEVELLTVAGDRVRARTRTQPDHPMYSGHFPGFPITPGVYLVEFVHRAVQAALTGTSEVRLEWISSCRFLGPAFPGDELVADVTLVRTGAELRCSGTVTTARGVAAQVTYTASVEDVA